MPKLWTLRPTPSDDGARVDVVLSRRLPLTRNVIAGLCDQGRVYGAATTPDADVSPEVIPSAPAQFSCLDPRGLIPPDAAPLRKGDHVRPGQTLYVWEDNPVPSSAQAQDIPLDIVYEDDDLLVLNKARGLVVHPAAGHFDGTLVNALLHHCRGHLSGIGGVERPGIVHRLDRDTSGLLAVAKTDMAHVHLSEQLRSRDMSRRYEALVCGRLKEDSGRVEAPIGRDPRHRKRMAVVLRGKPAVTHFEVLAYYTGFTHLGLKLETGRTHQIRVHMRHLGHPLLGDLLYGGRDDFGLKGQCLHAAELKFYHPRTGAPLSFVAPCPSYFEDILRKLR